MAGINTELDILVEVMEKKEKLLKELLSDTKKQESLLNEEALDMEAFDEIISNKQEKIDQVNTLDDGFKMTYEKIHLQLGADKDLYKDYITAMKEKIVVIGELGVEIMVQEEKNKVKFLIAAKNEKNKMKDFRKSKQTVANYYSNMNNQKNPERSYFFDKKK